MRGFQRGEVWSVDFGLAAKVRPALILTGEPADSELDLVTVILHTTAVRGNHWELNIPKPFLKPGAFHLQQVQSVRRQSSNAVSAVSATRRCSMCSTGWPSGCASAETGLRPASETLNFSLCTLHWPRPPRRPILAQGPDPVRRRQSLDRDSAGGVEGGKACLACLIERAVPLAADPRNQTRRHIGIQIGQAVIQCGVAHSLAVQHVERAAAADDDQNGFGFLPAIAERREDVRVFDEHDALDCDQPTVAPATVRKVTTWKTAQVVFIRLNFRLFAGRDVPGGINQNQPEF
ncbi:MAG: type II toxin-antitoxin system PemK/MazF family toxin [Verrucomicrobia bacterium]|nr:type II toxin-antitoxin system PemK/MazF family toxin [Verrucomicrobiota bacterium]